MKDIGYYLDRPWNIYADQCNTLIIENGVVKIGAQVFSAFYRITGNLEIPESVTYIR